MASQAHDKFESEVLDSGNEARDSIRYDRVVRKIRAFQKRTDDTYYYLAYAKIADPGAIATLRKNPFSRRHVERDLIARPELVKSPAQFSQSLYGEPSDVSSLLTKLFYPEPSFEPPIPARLGRYSRSNITQSIPQRLLTNATQDPPIVYSEFPITSALWMLTKDTIGVVREGGPARLFGCGIVLSVTSWLLGGFDAQVRVAAALAGIFSILKVIEDLKDSKFAEAAWRPLHFVLWMVLIALGNLADKGLQFNFLEMRQLLLVVVMGSCFTGSLYTSTRLLGKGDRVVKFVARQKRAFHEFLFGDDEEDRI